MNAETSPHPLILIVEDDEASREAVSALLESAGYHTVGAANGEDALDLLRHGLDPCLILLDLMMPVKDGWSFRAEQMQDQRLARVRTIVLSAVADAPPLQGVVASLRKPIEIDTLLDLVAKHC
jgi:CheY-like chemotaxis protein